MAITVAQLVVDLTQAATSIDEKAARVVEDAGFDVSAHAKTIVPVDTGATRDSISAQSVESPHIDLIVGPETHYAPHLEFGTSRMAPRPFMDPAADAVRPSFEKALADLLDDF